MAGILEALLALIGLGVLITATWAAVFAEPSTPIMRLREVRRIAEAEMRRAADGIHGSDR